MCEYKARGIKILTSTDVIFNEDEFPCKKPVHSTEPSVPQLSSPTREVTEEPVVPDSVQTEIRTDVPLIWD